MEVPNEVVQALREYFAKFPEVQLMGQLGMAVDANEKLLKKKK